MVRGAWVLENVFLKVTEFAEGLHMGHERRNGAKLFGLSYR